MQNVIFRYELITIFFVYVHFKNANQSWLIVDLYVFFMLVIAETLIAIIKFF